MKTKRSDTQKGYHLDKDGFMKGLNNEHTPTPLICTCKYQRDKSVMHEGNCNTSREIPYPPKVVRAVNSHEELVQLLGDIQYTWTGSPEMNLRMVKALNKAEGKGE